MRSNCWKFEICIFELKCIIVSVCTSLEEIIMGTSTFSQLSAFECTYIILHEGLAITFF